MTLPCAYMRIRVAGHDAGYDTGIYLFCLAIILISEPQGSLTQQSIVGNL